MAYRTHNKNEQGRCAPNRTLQSITDGKRSSGRCPFSSLNVKTESQDMAISNIPNPLEPYLTAEYGPYFARECRRNPQAQLYALRR